MKTRTKIKAFFMTIFILTLLPTLTQAAGTGRLRLAITEQSVPVDQQIAVQVAVEEATAVYGTEFTVLFDPAMLEVVSVEHGDFLSANPDQETFILKNESDNEQGTINYALSLLNPAPPVDGGGVLLHIVFQTKAEGQTLIQFEEGMFGTQTGEEIVPALENVELTIGNVAPLPLADTQVEQTAAEPQPLSASSDNTSTWLGLSLVVVALLIGGIGILGVGLLFGIWFWLNRAKRKKKPVQPGPYPSQHVVR